jgi:GT2 family glycosyltransferase
MNLLIVIVNYRSSSLAIDCLRSLEPEVAAVPGSRVVVVENASGDDSSAVLSTAIEENGWGSWAELVNAPRNGGFAAGNNVALRPAFSSETPPDYAWLLNPDTVVRPGGLVELVKFLESRPEVGLAGSRLEHPDGQPQQSAFRFPSILGEIEGGMRFGPVTRLLKNHAVPMPVPEAECRVDWVAGASLLVEGYFMYFEEVDFCLKANRSGWPCWYVPSSRVVHLVGQSSGVTASSTQRKRRPRYWFEARQRFFIQNHGGVKTLAANLGFATTYASARLRGLIQRKPNNDPERMFRDFLRYNFSVKR